MKEIPEHHFSKELIANLYHPLFTLSFFLAKVFIDNQKVDINDLIQSNTNKENKKPEAPPPTFVLLNQFEYDNKNNQESVYTRARDYMLSHDTYGGWFKKIISLYLSQEIKSHHKESLPLCYINKDTELKTPPSAGEKHGKYLKTFLDIIKKQLNKPDSTENNQTPEQPEQNNEIPPNKACSDKIQSCLTRCVGSLISLLTQMRIKRKNSEFSQNQLRTLCDEFYKSDSKSDFPEISVDLLNHLISIQNRSISRTDSSSSMELSENPSQNSSRESSRRGSLTATARNAPENAIRGSNSYGNFRCILEEGGGDDPARRDEAMETKYIDDIDIANQGDRMETLP